MTKSLNLYDVYNQEGYGFLASLPLVGQIPGAHFINDFSIIIQFFFLLSALIQVAMKWSLWNFAHGTTAELSCYMQNFVAIRYPMMELHLNQVPVEFELRWKNRWWNGPWTRCEITTTVGGWHPARALNQDNRHWHRMGSTHNRVQLIGPLNIWANGSGFLHNEFWI